MRPITLFLTLLLSVALPACQAKTGATNTPPPQATTQPGSAPLVNTPAYINPGHVTIGPGGVYYFTPEPVTGTPEPNPKLTLRISLVDACTGHPVHANVLTCPGEQCQGVGDEEQGARKTGDLIYQGVSDFTLELPGETVDDVIYVTVEAEGYEVWSQGYPIVFNCFKKPLLGCCQQEPGERVHHVFLARSQVGTACRATGNVSDAKAA